MHRIVRATLLALSLVATASGMSVSYAQHGSDAGKLITIAMDRNTKGLPISPDAEKPNGWNQIGFDETG